MQIGLMEGSLRASAAERLGANRARIEPASLDQVKGGLDVLAGVRDSGAEDRYLLDFDYFAEGEGAHDEDAVISTAEAFTG